jgi:triosephosphate isomerase
MKRLVAGNWKMHETTRAAQRLASSIVASVRELDIGPNVQVAIAPPFTALAAVGAALAGSPVLLGAQNMHWEDDGAFTGEISAPMLIDLGVRCVILGHSERRRYFGESDAYVNAKLRAALAHGLLAIVAVGETNEEHDAGIAGERVVAQTRAAFDGIARERLPEVAIAYEPIWAIGSGRNCDPDEAERVMSTIRSSMPGLEGSPILYGGSIKPENFGAYLALPNCNGGLIGGASLDAGAFAELVRLARDTAPG